MEELWSALISVNHLVCSNECFQSTFIIYGKASMLMIICSILKVKPLVLRTFKQMYFWQIIGLKLKNN